MKKYEKALKRTMQGLAEICKKLKEMAGDEHIKTMKPTKEEDEDLYRESMDVLGFNMNELNEFMNPTAANQASKQISEILECFDDIIETTSSSEITQKLT